MNKKSFFVRFLRSIRGVGSTRPVACSMNPNQTSRCTLSSTASEARFINLQKQRHRSGRSEARLPLAQSRQPTAYHERNRAVANPDFRPLVASTDLVTTSLTKAVSPSLLDVWGSEAAPADPSDRKIDSLLSGAGETNLPLAAALRGGRVPSLASLDSNRFFLTSCVIRIYNTNRSILDRTQIMFFSNFSSITTAIIQLRSLSRQAVRGTSISGMI